MAGLSGLLRRRNSVVLTPRYQVLVCASIQTSSSFFGPSTRWNRLDGLGGGGFGGLGDGGRSRDWQTADARDEVQEAMTARVRGVEEDRSCGPSRADRSE